MHQQFLSLLPGPEFRHYTDPVVHKPQTGADRPAYYISPIVAQKSSQMSSLNIAGSSPEIPAVQDATRAFFFFFLYFLGKCECGGRGNVCYGIAKDGWSALSWPSVEETLMYGKGSLLARGEL